MENIIGNKLREAGYNANDADTKRITEKVMEHVGKSSGKIVANLGQELGSYVAKTGKVEKVFFILTGFISMFAAITILATGGLSLSGHSIPQWLIKTLTSVVICLGIVLTLHVLFECGSCVKVTASTYSAVKKETQNLNESLPEIIPEIIQEIENEKTQAT